jgi:hypothetical protein
MYYSASKRCLLALAAIALTASRNNPRPPTSPPQGIRPEVMLVVVIDAREYLQKINDTDCLADCRIVRDALADSVLAIVRSAYPFLSWEDPQNATDTVVVRLTSKNIDTPWILLELRALARDARRPADSTRMDFENFRAFRDRDDRNDWSAPALRREWAKRMREMLVNDNMVESVFGKIPINAPAHSLSGNKWYVGVAPESIHEDVNASPIFDVRTLYSHPENGDDSVSVRLSACMHTDGWKAYKCEISRIGFGSGRVVTGPAIDTVMTGASLSSVSTVHLVTFKPGQGGAHL